MSNFIHKINFRLCIFILGFLGLANGFFMLLSAAVSWIYDEGILFNILIAGGIATASGSLIMLASRGYNKEIKTRESFFIVTVGWLFMTLTGTLPYLISGVIPHFTDAFFESMSGFTTTGATILNDVEVVPNGILFWRSFTNWIGGMGMIVLTIALFPLMGIGGMQLFSAESPGPESSKLSPKIRDTAKWIWLIYVGYTLVETILLKGSGMNMFDAINHSMTSLSTGGFSTRNDSLAYWDNAPLIQYIVTFFMFLGGTNFILSYYGIKGKLQKVFRDEEFCVYFFLVTLFIVITTLAVYFYADPAHDSLSHPMIWGPLESSFRHAALQVVSILTTTGFVSADFSRWTPFLTVLFLGIMLIGASAGSTSGGPKVIRYTILFKDGITAFRRILHPAAILPIRLNKKSVAPSIVSNIIRFFVLYMLTFGVGTLVFSALGLDLITALGSAATALGNVGPGLGDFGPIGNFSKMPTFGKWWSSFLMLAGRLELFTVFILFSPAYWRH